MKKNRNRISNLSNKEREELINKLYPTDINNFNIIEIDSRIEAITLLSSMNADKNILRKYVNKNNIDSDDLKEIENLIYDDNITLDYDQRLSLAKIRSTLS